MERAPRGAGNVFDRLWRTDAGPGGNAASVAVVGPGGQWTDPAADVLLDDQEHKASLRHSTTDHAARPLFKFGPNGAAALWRRPTYRRFVALLDNYAQRAGVAETVTDEERNEQDAFLASVAETPVFDDARRHVARVTGRAWPARALVDRVHNLWFELRTLEFNGEAIADCSAFEHVFIGELGAHNAVLGYHSWIKFALDEAHGKTEFLGWRYDGRKNRLGAARKNPDFAKVKFVMRKQSLRGLRTAADGFGKTPLATMAALAEHDVGDDGGDDDGGVSSGGGGGTDHKVEAAVAAVAAGAAAAAAAAPAAAEWTDGGVKKSGTFFVGISPEAQIMFATVAWFEATQSGCAADYGWERLKSSSHLRFRNANVVINGHKYTLFLDATEDFIISFYQDHKGKVKLPPPAQKKRKQKTKKKKRNGCSGNNPAAAT